MIRQRRRRLHTKGGGESAELLCSPPVPVDDLAFAVGPVDEERYANDPDLCGHYFFPYELAAELQAAFGDFEVSDMDVRWPPSAYAANAADHPQLDYSLVAKDTHEQGRVHKSSIFLRGDA